MRHASRASMLLVMAIGLWPSVPLAQDRPVAQRSIERDGSHDFDFDVGVWKTRTSRLLRPLTGSSDWVELEGVTVVEPVWGGRANLAEFTASGPSGPVTLLSLRLYDPAARQWRLSFATPIDGALGVPCVGEFRDGRGEFHDQESLGGRSILVRFSIWSITADTARSEQAFSIDGGRTWEVNWINRYTRVEAESS